MYSHIMMHNLSVPVGISYFSFDESSLKRTIYSALMALPPFSRPTWEWGNHFSLLLDRP